VNKLSKVKVLYLNNGKEIIVELADFLSNKPVANDGILRIKNDTPLAKSIIGKAIGDTVQVGKGDYYVQILKLLK
jgi:transcription elongation GreA/GreB family factor